MVMMSVMGHKRPDQASSRSADVGNAAESGSKFQRRKLIGREGRMPGRRDGHCAAFAFPILDRGAQLDAQPVDHV